MKKIKLFKQTAPIILLANSLAAFAATTIPQDLNAGWQSITTKEIKNDITYLTSDQLEGRLALSHGEHLTIDWLVNQFKSMGLKPGNGNSYLQTFNVISYTPDIKHTSIELMSNGHRYTWKKPDIITHFQSNVTLKGDIVFAGYGITAPELNYDDYANINVKGKFVLVFEHEPQERMASSIFNGTGNTPYATNRIKALNAQAHGAIGILIAPEPNRKHPSNQQRYTRIGGSTTRKSPLPSMVLENDELQTPIVVLSDKVSNEIAHGLSLSQLQKTIDKTLKPQSQLIPNTTLQLEERNTKRVAAQTSNVVGLIEGTDPALKNETIIISSHHDHDGKSGKQIWHGADDNASGTAGVLTLAHALAENTGKKDGKALKRSVLFAIFAAEERGLLGSYYMADHPLRPLATSRAMINFDMIGRDEIPSVQTTGLITIPKNTNNRLNLIGAHFSPDYDDVVNHENRLVGLTIDHRFDNENALNSFFRSDQFPFVLHHIPAFWWFTGFHPDYHHTTDTADKINYDKMQKIVRLGYLSTYAFANSNSMPRFIANPKPNID